MEKSSKIILVRDLRGQWLLVQGDKVYPMEIKKAKMSAHADKNFSVLDKFKMDSERIRGIVKTAGMFWRFSFVTKEKID